MGLLGLSYRYYIRCSLVLKIEGGLVRDNLRHRSLVLGRVWAQVWSLSCPIKHILRDSLAAPLYLSLARQRPI